MKIMEKWQASIKKDKNFLREMLKHDTLVFTVKTDGTIEITGKDTDKADKSDKKSRNSKSKQPKPSRQPTGTT